MAGNDVLDGNYLAITAIVTVCYQLFFFFIAFAFKFDKLTDFAGGSNFIVLALLTAILHGTWYTRQLIVTLLVVAWGVRLALFLLFRILLWGEDRRFDDTRNDFFKFLAFWVYQMLWVWIVCLSVTIVNSSERNPAIGALDVIGWLIWAIGLTVETFADFQKLAFKRDETKKGQWCDVGVWKWSRHPNYFGEIFLWIGVFVASTPVLSGGQWVAILSPMWTALILLFVSGMPLLEASADKKYGSREDYRKYKEETSPLIPLPPMLYRNMPSIIKTIFFFEWPIYNTKVSSTEAVLNP